ncbi:MAG: helix-turn-helix domain-containing protein [bacterium]|nr:helix-turn-helix domain-containing protein [bacterium]
MKIVLREKAEKLRQEGYSYTYISKKLNVAKSTLSYWLPSVPYVPNNETIAVIGKARAASGLAKHKLKLKSITEATTEAKKEMAHLSERDFFMVGLGIYIGEGTKTHGIVRLINSNPDIIKFAVGWFKDSCGLNLANIRIRLHIYPDNNEKKCIEFWSNATGVPMRNFQRTYIDRRTNKKLAKRGKLPYGTAHVSIRSLGEKKFGVFLSRKINAWIEEVLK